MKNKEISHFYPKVGGPGQKGFSRGPEKNNRKK